MYCLVGREEMLQGEQREEEGGTEGLKGTAGLGGDCAKASTGHEQVLETEGTKRTLPPRRGGFPRAAEP